jgi:hypothetical protein
MRLAFLINRKNYYRVLGPAVDAALARGWDVECWHDWSQPRRGAKASEFPDVVPAFRHGTPRVRIHMGASDLATQWRADPPDAVIALDPPSTEVRAAAPVRFVWLQYSTDIVCYPTEQGLLDADAIATYSPYWAQKLEERYSGADPGNVRQKIVPVGVPELDSVRLADPEEVRRRFGIEPGRPVVLYLPFPLHSNPQTFWLRHVHAPSSWASRRLRILLGRRPEYRANLDAGWNDRALVQAMRDFCDREGAVLVMKARAKDPVPSYARQLADRVVYDPSVYPPTILELLSTASLCVHFYSTACFEAVYARVPSLCLAPEAADLGLADLILDMIHNGKPGGIYNWPGASYWQPLAEAFAGLRRWRLADFSLSESARREYVEHFLGPDDGGSSERLLDLCARCVR